MPKSRKPWTQVKAIAIHSHKLDPRSARTTQAKGELLRNARRTLQSAIRPARQRCLLRRVNAPRRTPERELLYDQSKGAGRNLNRVRIRTLT